MCDYVVVSLSTGGLYGAKSSGLNQYYTNPKALDKLLKTTSETRAAELGRLAAFEYEKVTQDDQDYLTSIKRQFQRTSIISKLTPMSLFLKIDPIAAGADNPSKIEEVLKTITSKCIQYNYDGIIIDNQTSVPDTQNQIIK